MKITKYDYSEFKEVDYDTLTYLEDFLTKLDKLFTGYKNDGIFEGYRRVGTFRMEISEESNKENHGYMWAAIDGAIWMYNQEHPKAKIVVDEYSPRDGVITYEFSCHA